MRDTPGTQEGSAAFFGLQKKMEVQSIFGHRYRENTKFHFNKFAYVLAEIRK
jgi:hypothetical protein